MEQFKVGTNNKTGTIQGASGTVGSPNKLFPSPPSTTLLNSNSTNNNTSSNIPVTSSTIDTEHGGMIITLETGIQKRVKMTCDACVASKVKCSSTFPSCERCLKRGTKCVYGEEKRRGRPLKNSHDQQFTDDFSTNSKNGNKIPRLKKDTNDERLAKKDNPNALLGGVCSPPLCWAGTKSSKVPSLLLDHKDTSVLERRIFSTFFSLYKHHKTSLSCCKAWFSHQLSKMLAYLKHGKKMSSFLRLLHWLNANKIFLEKSLEVDEFRKIGAPVKQGPYLLPPTLGAIGPVFSNVPPMITSAAANENDAKLPQLKTKMGADYVLTVDGMHVAVDPSVSAEIERMRHDQERPFLCLSFSNSQFEVRVNDQFTQTFGYSAQDLSQHLDRFLGGFLPWGGDVMALLLAPGEDLVSYLHVLAVRFNRVFSDSMTPREFPCVSEPYIVQDVNVITKNGVILNCFCPSIYREVLSHGGSRLEMYLQLVPKALQPSMKLLLQPQALPSEIVSLKTEEASSTSSLLPSNYAISGSFSNNNNLDLDDSNSSSFVDDEWIDSLLNWTENAPQDDISDSSSVAFQA